MREIDLVLPRLHAAQQQVKREAKRFNVVDCGRRWGKTVLAEDLLIHPALKGQPVAYFAPSYKMMVEVWQEMVRRLHPVTRRISQQDKRIELITGGVVDFWSLDNPDAARGRKYGRAVIDEAAMIKMLLEAWNYVIRPTLLDYTGDAWFKSTPKGKNGFWALFQWGMDKLNDEWMAWQMPTATNPFMTAEEIEAVRASVPERTFRQEFLAEFLDDGGGVFRGVQAAAVLNPLSEGVPGKRYAHGIDWGRSHDFTVISVIDPDTGHQVYMDRFTGIGYELQMGRVETILQRFPPSIVVPEKNSMGGPLVETLEYKGYPVLPFVTSNASKMQLIDSCVLALERGQLGLLNDPIQTGELEAFEMESLASGLLRYSAPEGFHDDTVMALALAWRGASNTLEGQLFY